MKIIEVYHHVGPDRRFISRMWFLNDEDLHEMACRLTAGYPFNSLRRDRHEVCQLLFIYENGFESEYYTDGMPSNVLSICTEYAFVYDQARKLAEARVWKFAWEYGTEEWKRKAILKRMRKAEKLLTTATK